MQVDTFVGPKAAFSSWEEVVIPGFGTTNLKMLRGKFPKMGILDMRDSSLTVPTRIVPKSLSTCSVGSVDGERYGGKLEVEKRKCGKVAGVAGYQHARWLLQKRPQVLLELLRDGFCLEFPGTVILVPRLAKGKVSGSQKLIPLMPRIHGGSGLQMTWGSLGAGDLDPKTRVAFAVPPVG